MAKDCNVSGRASLSPLHVHQNVAWVFSWAAYTWFGFNPFPNRWRAHVFWSYFLFLIWPEWLSFPQYEPGPRQTKPECRWAWPTVPPDTRVVGLSVAVSSRMYFVLSFFFLGLVSFWKGEPTCSWLFFIVSVMLCFSKNYINFWFHFRHFLRPFVHGLTNALPLQAFVFIFKQRLLGAWGYLMKKKRTAFSGFAGKTDVCLAPKLHASVRMSGSRRRPNPTVLRKYFPCDTSVRGMKHAISHGTLITSRYVSNPKYLGD